MITDINSEDRLVQKTLAEQLEKAPGWENVYAYGTEMFGTYVGAKGLLFFAPI